LIFLGLGAMLGQPHETPIPVCCPDAARAPSSPRRGRTTDDPAALATKRILFFSKSSGWEHEVIRDPAVTGRPVNKSGGNQVPGLAFQVLKELGAKDNLKFVFSKDGSLFTPGVPGPV
jgi:hypothetical protein